MINLLAIIQGYEGRLTYFCVITIDLATSKRLNSIFATTITANAVKPHGIK